MALTYRVHRAQEKTAQGQRVSSREHKCTSHRPLACGDDKPAVVFSQVITTCSQISPAVWRDGPWAARAGECGQLSSDHKVCHSNTGLPPPGGSPSGLAMPDRGPTGRRQGLASSSSLCPSLHPENSKHPPAPGALTPTSPTAVPESALQPCSLWFPWLSSHWLLGPTSGLTLGLHSTQIRALFWPEISLACYARNHSSVSSHMA